MEKKMDLIKYYREQSDEVIKEFLGLGRDSFEEEAYDLILAEAKHRRLKEEPPHIDALEAQKNENNEGAAEKIPQLSNPLPLIIIDNPEDAQPLFKALIEAGIPYNIQIIVEEDDYEKADYVISNLQLKNSNERGI